MAAQKSVAAGLPAPIPPFADFRPLFRVNALVFGAAALALGARDRARRGVRRAPADPGRHDRRRDDDRVRCPSVAVGLGLVANHRAVRELARNVARLAGPDDVVAHEGPIENSGAFEWYAGRRPVIVDGRRSVLGFGAERPEARDLFWDEARLREAWASGRRVWVVSVRSPGAERGRRAPGRPPSRRERRACPSG